MSLRDSIRIMVVDDMSISRALITQSLEEIGVKHIGIESDPKAALGKLAAQPVHLVISDMNMPGMSGLDAIGAIRKTPEGADLPVIVISGHASIADAVQAMKLGASDVIPKPIDTEHLLSSVRDALRRDVHLGAMQGGRRPVEVRGFSQLTPREREVLQLITNGQSNKEAGRELGISPRTIEVHRARVMEKLGARNTADLMRIVLTS